MSLDKKKIAKPLWLLEKYLCPLDLNHKKSHLKNSNVKIESELSLDWIKMLKHNLKVLRFPLSQMFARSEFFKDSKLQTSWQSLKYSYDIINI